VTIEDKIEACARAAHEANRAYCIAVGEALPPHWEDAPDWMRQSTRNGVAGAFAGNTPEESHASWLAEKIATGWKYGPVKDPEKREHPCVLPYAELPLDQRAKDHLYLAVVRAMAAAIEGSTHA
jgi:hypothetical protein